jgi:transposase
MLTSVSQPEAGPAEALAGKDRLLAEKEAEITRLRERIRLLEKALFGPRSERLIQDPADQQVFADLLKEVEDLNRELERSEDQLPPERPAPAPSPARRRIRRNLDQLIPEGLREEDVIVDLPAEEKISLETGLPLVKIGEHVTRKLAVKPPEYYVKRFVFPRYADPAAVRRGVVCAPAPDFAIPGGTFDESFIADVVVNKTAMHLPLYRQEERLRGLGIEVSRQTLCSLYLSAAEVLRPLYLRMKKLLIACGVIFTDDTPIALQMKGHGKTVTGRMWVYVAGGAGPPWRVFEFTVDRCKKRPKEFLEGYLGYIHADAYKGYDDLFKQEGVFECGCWMHVRRKFFEAVDAPKDLREAVLRAIRHIFRYDKFARRHPTGGDELVLTVRREKIAPLIDWLFARTARALMGGEVLPASAFAGAIGYMHNLANALRTFLADARLRPDNGESERALRPLAIGRKNWLFAGSKGGGDATGILLSLVQTCRVMDIDPFVYIEDVLRRINGHPAARLDELLPGNWRKAESYY